MKCATCRKPLGTSDRRRRYCSDFCRANKPDTSHLRAVGADERPPAAETAKPRTLTVDVAARDGSDLEFLMSIRDRVADQVADVTCPPRELASLTKRLEEIRKQIGVERARLREEAVDAADAPDEKWDETAI